MAGMYGKDAAPKSSSGYISEALHGGSGKSDCITEEFVGHGQKINSAYPQDNQEMMSLPDTMGGKMGGGTDNLKHSLKGAVAVDDDIGAAGPVKHNYND